jgi:hypothetical protein
VSRPGSRPPAPGGDEVSERDLELLSAYHDRELSADEQWRVWRRLRSEPALRRARERIARLRAFARATLAEEPRREREWNAWSDYGERAPGAGAFYALAPAMVAEERTRFGPSEAVLEGLAEDTVSDVMLAERALKELLESLDRIARAVPGLETDVSGARQPLLLLRKRLWTLRFQRRAMGGSGR